MRSLFSDIYALGISQKEKVKGSDEVLADRQDALESQTCPHPGKRCLMLKSGAVWLEEANSQKQGWGCGPCHFPYKSLHTAFKKQECVLVCFRNQFAVDACNLS